MHPATTAVADQAWATLRERFTDIRRIAIHGPRFGDEALVTQICCIVSGELIIRDVQAREGN